MVNIKTVNRQYIYCKCNCGQVLISHDRYGRKREFIHGHQINLDNPNKGGSTNPNWKGGIMHGVGYIFIKSPNHPFHNPNGYIQEHRLIMEKYLSDKYSMNIFLLPYWSVHHKNGIKDDNRIENLQIMNDHEHKSYHAKNKKKCLL